MTERITFPDVIELLADHLRTELGDVHVGNRVPNPRPDAFVRVDRVGGIVENRVVDGALLVIEAWAQTEPEAHALAAECREIVHAMEGETIAGTPVYRVLEAAGPATLPDPVSDQARATQTVTVKVRGYSAA